MKIKLILCLSLLSFSRINFSQVVSHDKKSLNRPTQLIQPNNQNVVSPQIEVIFDNKNERNPAADQYILDIKSLRAYFKHNKIPKKFPLYNQELTYEENKKAAFHWISIHKRLLTPEKRAWLNKKMQH